MNSGPGGLGPAGPPQGGRGTGAPRGLPPKDPRRIREGVPLRTAPPPAAITSGVGTLPPMNLRGTQAAYSTGDGSDGKEPRRRYDGL